MAVRCPYRQSLLLGDDTLEPFVRAAQSQNAGVFVLVKTSNPGSGFLQDAAVAGGQTIYQRVAELVEKQSMATWQLELWQRRGAVVGATYPEQLQERGMMPHAWILIPGYEVCEERPPMGRTASNSRGLGAIVTNSSRGIIFAYTLPQYAASMAGCRIDSHHRHGSSVE
ncbi:MAG: orotidine 5'-phosphate decarboxylase / HUMPS family protein [Pirellulaceae bacterium]